MWVIIIVTFYFVNFLNMQFRSLWFIFLFSVFIVWILWSIAIFSIFNTWYDNFIPSIMLLMNLSYAISIIFLMPIWTYLIMITKNKENIISKKDIMQDIFLSCWRLNRWRYFLLSIYISFCNSLIKNFDSIEFFKPYLHLLLYYFIIIFIIKRLHDLNKSWLYIIPYIILVILFIFLSGVLKTTFMIIILILTASLLFIPGSKWVNKYWA